MDILIPGNRKTLAISCAVGQIEVDKRLVGDANLLCLSLEITQRFDRQADRYLLLRLLDVGILLPFAEIVFFSHDGLSFNSMTCFILLGD